MGSDLIVWDVASSGAEYCNVLHHGKMVLDLFGWDVASLGVEYSSCSSPWKDGVGFDSSTIMDRDTP